MSENPLKACRKNNEGVESGITPSLHSDFKANFRVMLTVFVAGVGLMGLKF